MIGTKWEYQITDTLELRDRFEECPEENFCVFILNKMGELGWELVNADSMGGGQATFIFKRPLP